MKCKKARRSGLFCSKRVAGGCLRSRNRLGVLQGACLGRSRFGDAVAAARAGDGHRGAHLAGQVIHQGPEGVRWVAELGLPGACLADRLRRPRRLRDGVFGDLGILVGEE